MTKKRRKEIKKKYRASPKGIATRRAYQRIVQQRYRERWRNDPMWRERERAMRRKSYAKMVSNPEWRKQKNAKQKLRSAKHRLDPKWRKRQGDRYKELQLLKWLRTRNWSMADYKRMQKAGCGICRATKKKLLKDHDHTTGLARGLLCHKCNCSLGWAENHADAVRKYLSS